MWLLVGWPPMVWAVGGRWWGLGGILSHVAAIVLFGNRVTSTTATFLIHALWIVISWLFLLRCAWSQPGLDPCSARWLTFCPR